MSSLWESVKDTAESIGGAAKGAASLTPIGVVWDLATAAFDDEDDNFGTITNRMAGHGADVLDPLLNDRTLTGLAIGKAMRGLEWTYREGISEPLVTANTMYSHAMQTGNWADIFSGEKWGEAYDVAQNRSLGQSAVVGNPFNAGMPMDFYGDNLDPLDKRAYKQAKKNNGFQAGLVSGAYDFTARWYLDPGVVAGKGAKALKAAKQTRKITADDFAGSGILAKSFEEKNGVKPFDVFAKAHLGSRVAKLEKFIKTGANGKPLNGAQAYVAIPELHRSAAGRQIAGLLADAARIEDPKLSGIAFRNILAVSWGDTQALRVAQHDLAEMGALGDALKNVAKGNVLDLKTHALGDQVRANPYLMASMQKQIDNLDDVQKFVENHVRKLETLVDTADTLRYAPGVHRAGRKALKRESGETLGRKVPDAIDNWVAERAARFAELPAVSAIYQRSPAHMPLKVITHSLGSMARMSTTDLLRFPSRAADALRTSHLQGFVSTHDWNGAVNQLDSMLKLGKVTPAERMNLLSRAQMARNEVDKVAAIHEVEKATARALVAKHGVNREFADHKELQDFIEEVMSRGHAKRSSTMAALYGRAYAATKNSADEAGNRVDQVTPRVNLIDEVDGAPVALPLLETQGRNMVPLFDAGLADKMMAREYGFLMKNARVWKQAQFEIGRLKELQAATGRNVEKALHGWYWAMDHAVDAAAFTMRAWKFSVLFRLGYPLRVISDDHMRIWSQIGGMSLMAPLARETAGNVAYNQFGRYRKITKDVNQAKVRLAAINDMLSAENLTVRDDVMEEIASLNRRIVKAEAAGNGSRVDTLTIQRDWKMEAMGDDPADLLREKDELESFLSLSKKEQVKALRKRRRGEKTFNIDGFEYEGAFGGDMGSAYRLAAGSNDTFDNLAKVGEERLFTGTSSQGAWRVIHPDDPTHAQAWADVLNNQMRQSKVAMFFLKNEDATVDDFVRWIKQPEQRGLRERLPQFAHDPEDWGNRVYQLVYDYAPSRQVREVLRKGRVTPRQMERLFPDITARPAVHGATVAHNIGEVSRFATTVGQTMNRLYRFIGELPTDNLSRHPYFAAMYEQEVKRLHQLRLNEARRTGLEFGQRDVDEIVATARKNALSDLKRTLFDISAHSNAAHVMRFISPFFAAHQEALTRWWRIVGDDPSIIRRFQQGFDIPRKLGLVVDSETGEPVKEGEMPGPGHSILLQVPEAWGGSNTRLGKLINEKTAGWRVNENSFNLILQNGIMNPGIGPIVQLPVEAVVMENAQYEDLERLARLINPYPPESLGSMMLPATVRRVQTIIQKEKSSEYARMFSTNLQDKVVDFKLAHGGREPNQREIMRIEEDARNETNLEAWMRLGQNALSPAPASPRSRYEVFRQGWRKINDQAETEGRDYDWRIEQFKKKYGEAYLPMIASTANNPGDLDATNETVAVLKKNRKIIDKVDIRLAGAIVGAAGKYAGPEDYSNTSAKWLRDNQHRLSEQPFYSYDNPLQATREAAVKRGWSKYSQAMDTLNVIAQENGLQHYMQSDKLMAIKRAIVQGIAKDNIYWGEDYRDFNPGEFDALLDDFRMVTTDRNLRDRGDVQVLRKYLAVRDLFSAELKRRDAAGGSADPGAKANQSLMRKYRDVVALLAESNLDFEEFWFNGIVERDPMLDEVFFKGDVN